MAKPISKSRKVNGTSPNHAKMSWLEANGKIYCFVDPAGLCEIIRFVEVKSLSTFHDAELARCTKEINAILSKVKRNNKSRNRDLSILKTEKGLLLAWVEHGAHGPHDPGAAKALGIK